MAAGSPAESGSPVDPASASPNPNPLSGQRVLIVVENLPVPFDRRVWQEANALRGQGMDVSVISPKGQGAEQSFEIINGIHVFRHPQPPEARGVMGFFLEYPLALFWEFLLAWRVFFRRGFDVIHICNPPDLLFLVAAPFRLLGKRVIFDHHDINPELFEAKYHRRGIFHRLLCLVEWLTFRTCHVSIATNESYREVAVSRGRMKPENVYVVRSGPSLERLRLMPEDPAFRKGRQILIGYVGVIGQQEGIDHLLEALRILIDKLGFADFQCTICGGGPELEAMQTKCTELGLDDHVEFTGRIPEDELLGILNTADICVNPDVWNVMNDRSTMNKVMEYMALGKPIVQYDLREGRVSAQEASLYAKPNDRADFAARILELVKDPELRERMGKFGRKRVEQDLNWTVEEPKFLAVYRRVLSLEPR